MSVPVSGSRGRSRVPAVVRAAGRRRPAPHCFLVGGARSGKSELAERLALRWASERLYVATLYGGGAETRERIALHAARRGRGWHVIEAGPHLASCLSQEPRAGAVLVDSLGCWLSAALCGFFDSSGSNHPADAAEILASVREFAEAFRQSRRPVAVVSDEAGLGIVPADAQSRLFRDLLGTANRLVAEAATDAWFVSCGFPVRLKGRLFL